MSQFTAAEGLAVSVRAVCVTRGRPNRKILRRETLQAPIDLGSSITRNVAS